MTRTALRLLLPLPALFAAHIGGCERQALPVPRPDRALVAKARTTGSDEPTAGDDCRQKKTFFRDADGDGFGDPQRRLLACRAPAGFVGNRDDCYDQNRRAHPGQRDYFPAHRGDGSFDYDCDGQQTPRFTSRAFCRVKDSEDGCVHSSGWATGPNPKCGEPADFVWKVCKEQVLVKPPPGAPDAGVPLSLSAGALVPGASQKKLYLCHGAKLPWKKRQLCR